MNKKKKIIGGIIFTIILIGIIVVTVKGFNVGLSLRSHDTFRFVFEQKYNLKDVKNICNEVFKDKDYRIRGVEVFDDAIYVEASTITEEEQKVLSEKLGNLYQKPDAVVEGTEGEAEDSTSADENVVENVESTVTENIEEKNYEIFHDSNIRIRDEIKPYILPVCISALAVLVYTAIRFKKLNDGKVHLTLLSIILESLVLILTILSIIAIFRISFEKVVFSVLIIAEIIYLIIKFAYMENKNK